MKYMAFCQK